MPVGVTVGMGVPGQGLGVIPHFCNGSGQGHTRKNAASSELMSQIHVTKPDGLGKGTVKRRIVPKPGPQRASGEFEVIPMYGRRGYTLQ